MKIVSILSLIALLVFISHGCEKDESNPPVTRKIELFMIRNYSRLDNSTRIDENSVITEKQPFISYSDFISYDSAACIFELSDSAREAVKNIEYSSYGKAFAIKANDTLIYTGYFWSGYSSLSCDWVVIDPLEATFGNEIQVRLGYPDLSLGVTIPDKRNDRRIIRILNQDHKLKVNP